MLSLTEVLHISKEDYHLYKIHFAIGSDHLPMNEYLLGRFKNFQEYQTKDNFGRKYIISLIYQDQNIWMYAGVYEVLGKPVYDSTTKLFQYQTRQLDVQEDLIGRAFFFYKKDYRASYPTLELTPKNGTRPSEMKIHRIDANKMSIQDFPGFDKIHISFEILKTIINQEIPTWKNALTKAKGIYLIIDVKTGKQYVGSAYGEDAIWQRWSEYAKNGHGENKELKALLIEKDNHYQTNFQYSILEISNLNTSDLYIFERENHWKEVLLTRKFGYNRN